MATASLCGKTGSVSGVGTVAEIREWSCDLVLDALDATSMNSGGWREFIEGLKSGNGSLTAVGAEAPAVGTIATLTLACGGSGSGAPNISGKAILSNVSYSTPHDGVVEFSADFQFTGVITTGTVSGGAPMAAAPEDAVGAKSKK